MAIAERAVQRETEEPAVQPDVAKVGLLYPPQKARELALSFINNRDMTNRDVREGQITPEVALRLGVIEVQGQVLLLLGQDHIVSSRIRHAGIPLLRELKPITKADIDSLVESYDVASRYYFDHDLYLNRPWKTTADARINGRKVTLEIQLGILGKRDIAESIDDRHNRQRKKDLLPQFLYRTNPSRIKSG